MVSSFLFNEAQVESLDLLLELLINLSEKTQFRKQHNEEIEGLKVAAPSHGVEVPSGSCGWA